MRYCVRCLYPENHPLGITFDEEGVCSGCRMHEEKDTLDWEARKERLKKIFDAYRSPSQKYFDCVIPVSGGRDSYFIVHVVRNVFKMRPLLVSYNRQYNTKRGIRNLAYLRTLFGCDIINSTVSPVVVKKLTRFTLKKLGSMYWHCLAGQTAFPVQTAVRFKVPLIVWGAHQGCDQVGMFSHLDEVEMTRKYRKDHDLMGWEAEDIAKASDDISLDDLVQFRYPHDKEIETVGVRGIYLNNFIRWDTKAQHELMIKLYGYETAVQLRTFDTYNDVDCFHYSDLHDYIKYCKWGYGKATDHACREIRLKRLTREEGIELVKQYQDVSFDPQTLKLFLNWVGMSERELFDCVDRFRDSRIWERDRHSRFTLKDSVTSHVNDEGVKQVRLPKIEECAFNASSSRDQESKEDEQVLVGRGWVDGWRSP